MKHPIRRKGTDHRLEPRILVQIPLVHVSFDAFREDGSFEAFFGKNPDPDLVRRIEGGNTAYWDEVDRWLEGESFDKVYQEASVVESSAQEFLEGFGKYRGRDRNANAFFRLVERGVTFVTTESTYKRNESNRRRIFEEGDGLEPIDSYIASRINDTLCSGEKGVLFLGLDHKVDQILNERHINITAQRFPKDITYLKELAQQLAKSAEHQTHSA